MSLKRPREDNDDSTPDSHTTLDNSLASSSSLVSSSDNTLTSAEPPIKRIRQEYDRPEPTFFGSLFSSAFGLVRGMFSRDYRNGPPTHSQMRVQRKAKNVAKLPIGASGIEARPKGILAQLLETPDATEKASTEGYVRTTAGWAKSEGVDGMGGREEPADRHGATSSSRYPTRESSQELDDRRSASRSSGSQTGSSARGKTEYPPLLFPPSSPSSFADLAGSAAHDAEEVDGTASQPVVVSDDEDEDQLRADVNTSSKKTSGIPAPSTPARPPPRRPDLSGHVPPRHEYDWMISSDAGSSTSSVRSRSSSTASVRRKRKASGHLGSPQQRKQRQAHMLERCAQELLKQGKVDEAREFKRVLKHVQADLSSPSKMVSMAWKHLKKSGRDEKGLYAAMLDSPRTLDAMLHKPKPEVFSPEKSMKKADYAKARTAQIRTSSVDDIVENFSKAHLAEEAKIKKALDKTVPTPIRMAPERAGEVAAHLRDANFDFRILDKGLRQRDLITLKPSQWLNDEVINTYLTMVRDRSDKADGADGLRDVYEMSTFFYQKLSTQGYEKAKLARWTKRAKVDIFAKDLILIPVNIGGMHWTAAAINNVARRIEYYDSMGDRGGHRAKVFSNLRQYLREEHQNKKSAPFNEDGWTDHFIAGTPQQDNGSDCGVFTCQTLEALARGRDLTDVSAWDFGHRNMPYIRQLMILEFGQGKLEKRWPKE